MFPRSINLLAPPSKPANKTETIMNWVLIWGRFLTLICIIFIIGVFAYRVVIDTKRNQLIEDVEDAYQRVYQMREVQTKQLGIQRMLVTLKENQESQILLSERAFFYTKYISQAEVIEELRISTDSSRFTVIFKDMDSFKNFETAINQDEKLTNPRYKLDETYEDGSPTEVKIEGTVEFNINNNPITTNN